jgi:hypothetical protein
MGVASFSGCTVSPCEACEEGQGRDNATPHHTLRRRRRRRSRCRPRDVSLSRHGPARRCRSASSTGACA